MTKAEINAQIAALSRSIYGPSQLEMTPEQMHQATHGGLAGPVIDGTTFAVIKAEIIKLEALLPFAKDSL